MIKAVPSYCLADEAAKLLGVTGYSLALLRHHGIVRSRVNVDGVILYDRADVLAWSGGFASPAADDARVAALD